MHLLLIQRAMDKSRGQMLEYIGVSRHAPMTASVHVVGQPDITQ
jgi:hypothetical protein